MAKTRSSTARSSASAATSTVDPGSGVESSPDVKAFKKKVGHFSFESTANQTESGETGTNDESSGVSGAKRRAPTRSTRSPIQKRKRTSKYAEPAKYAHLNGLPDAIAPNLLCLLVGHNPGIKTAQTGHAYSHPSNLFWKLLHSSGLTPDRRCLPTDDARLPELYSLGLTNIVARPTRDTAELSKQEQADGTPLLEDKVRRFRPEVVVCVGKSIWEAVWRHRHGGKNPTKAEFRYGWQGEEHNVGRIEADAAEGVEAWEGARVFVATSTSGLAASLSPAEKEAIWKELGDWAQQRRRERLEQTS
jgi:mismatch-specific thymine-DNA glycosylase